MKITVVDFVMVGIIDLEVVTQLGGGLEMRNSSRGLGRVRFVPVLSENGQTRVIVFVKSHTLHSNLRNS